MAHMLPPGPTMVPEHLPNPDLVKKVVQQLKINGLFDEMRRECLADIDTKPAFQNLKQRVEGHVTGILAGQRWSPALNKNQLRSKIRESVMQSGILNEGVERILFQVFNTKVHSIFLPKIEDFIKEKGDEMRKEFLPPPIELPIMGNPQFVPPPVPVPPEMNPENLPPMPSQPPPPESPSVPLSNDPLKLTETIDHDITMETSMQERTEEIQHFPDQEVDIREFVPENEIVKAIKTPSPQQSPELNEDDAPKIPEDAVNPLRSLIQSLLVSKNSIIENDGDSSQETEEQVMDVGEETVKVEGYSPTIDPSEIEGFTDDEEENQRERGLNQGPQTPTLVEAYSPKMAHRISTSPIRAERDSPTSPPCNEPYSPTSPYSPLSPNHEFPESSPASSLIGPNNNSKVYAEPRSDTDSRMREEQDTPAYDPTKFSYQRMSDSTQYTEDPNAQSPPSPTSGDITDITDRDHLFSEESKYDTDMRQTGEKYYQRPQKERRQRRKSSSSSYVSRSGSSSGSVSSSTEDENDETIVEQEIVQEVEEMVEEIEVVEEFTSDSEGNKYEEEIEDIKSADSIEIKEKKKKRKSRKRKTKKARKRHRSSSISSGEITSSGELSSDSSGEERRPTRPTGPPKQKPQLDLQELEERRRIHMEDSSRDRPFWQSTESTSDYLSSPGRMRRPFSPSRRPFSPPDFHRYPEERYRPSAPHFRDRPMYPGEFRPLHHSRFSPPPPSYRRSPPLRYSPGPRMDYPGPMPFGSPRSPPRRPYSPPLHMGGFPGDRPPFPHSKPRWGSPPHPGHRRPSRSPPPGLRRDDASRPSRF